jgi:hypothetical protein
VGGALPASPNPTGVAGKEPIGINLCLRQPMRSSSCQPAGITEKRPIGVELCFRQPMNSSLNSLAFSREHRKETIRDLTLFTPTDKKFF